MTLDAYIQSKLEDYIHYWSKIVLGFGPLVVLVLIPLDYLVAPAHFGDFLQYRIVTSLCLFPLYFIHVKKIRGIDQNVILFLAGIIVSTMIALMIRKLGGHQSYYYAGIILVAIFCLGLVPISTGNSIIIAVTIYGIYLIPILLYDTIQNRPFFISANFLIFSCIASLVLLLFFSHKRLIKEFTLQYEVEQYRDRLEKRVAEEVEKSREKDGIMIKQAHLASLGELAAGVTHEINTPLTYIKGNIELLKMELPDSVRADAGEIGALFTDIEDGIRRISFIVDSMKELSGHTKKDRTPTNIYHTLIYANRLIYNRAKHIANVYINGRKFDLNIDQDKEIYTAPVSGQSIEQVWVVILNNALDELGKKDMPFHDRRINIGVGVLENAVKVQIKDNAGGIPEHALSKLFDMFFSTKEKSGTGLGLYIAKTIVESHGGSLQAGNENGGAVFTVTLPR